MSLQSGSQSEVIPSNTGLHLENLKVIADSDYQKKNVIFSIKDVSNTTYPTYFWTYGSNSALQFENSVDYCFSECNLTYNIRRWRLLRNNNQSKGIL